MYVPFTGTSLFLGYAPEHIEKSPLYRTVGTCFNLFYSFLFVLIAFAIAGLCRHSSLLLYKYTIESRTTSSPAINRLYVETAPLAPPFQNRE
jgi:hypothetical protein